jgi:hypothetical protein
MKLDRKFHHFSNYRPFLYFSSSSSSSFGIAQLKTLEHLHQLLVCDPALERFGDVQKSNTVNPLEIVKQWRTFRALDEPWKSLINTVKLYLLTGPCF